MRDASTEAAIEDLDEQMPRGAAEDEIPAIDEPSLGQGRWLRSEDEVIAVEAGGETRAYPIRVLDYHEIVNDEVGGRPVAVTFCPLAGAALAWDRRVDDRELSFQVSGRLYRNDLVMRDRETESLWPQLLGRAVHGELAGQRLDYVPTWRTNWDTFRARHPDSLVLDRPKRYRATRYETRSHPGYADREDTLFDPVNEDQRLRRKSWIHGLARGDDALAIRARDLEEVALTIATVDGEEVVLGHVEDRTLAWWTGERSFAIDEEGYLVGPEGQRWDPVRGRNGDDELEPAPLTRCFWFAWADVHPGTQLWHEQD